MTAIDQGQIQGIVFTGYPDLPFATYLVLAISDRGLASTWLQGLLPLITDGRKQTRATAVNVAFSHAGLAALGLSELPARVQRRHDGQRGALPHPRRHRAKRARALAVGGPGG